MAKELSKPGAESRLFESLTPKEEEILSGEPLDGIIPTLVLYKGCQARGSKGHIDMDDE